MPTKSTLEVRPNGTADIRAYLASKQEVDMRAAFKDAYEGVLLDEHKFIKPYNSVIVGLEVEYGLVSPKYIQVKESEREALKKGLNFTDSELGAFQFELRTDKSKLSSMENLSKLLTQNEEAVLRNALNQDIKVVRSGTTPFVPVSEIHRTTSKVKYTLVPNFHDDFKNEYVPTEFGNFGRIDPRPAQIISLFNSVQCNIEARSFDDAVDKANRTYMISPYLIAVGTNARFVEGKDLAFEDVRMPVWAISHDTRTNEEVLRGGVTRVGVYDSYLTSMRDYFERVGSFPFILNDVQASLKIGIGLFWKDVRIKIIEDSLVVEFRPISTQPTPTEDIAMQAFYIGRLLYSQVRREPPLDIAYVNANRETAMRFGIAAPSLVYLNENGVPAVGRATEVVRKEIAKAEEGLLQAGIDPSGFLDILRRRIDKRETPSIQFARNFEMLRRTSSSDSSMTGSFKAQREKYGNQEFEDAYA